MSSTFYVVRDLLDKKLIDSGNTQMGRVDGIVLEFPQGGQPRLVRVEIGGEILAIRVARWLIRPTRWLRQHFGPKRAARVKIEWRHVKRMGRDIHLDIAAAETDALAWERWLSDRIVSRIPGSNS
ncbi:MAG TPA: hypothetical protein VM053_05470 [Gemmatimonadaceae bacterium]|nr:hypothetical protein [Gemmatimonadaceae bacterium]